MVPPVSVAAAAVPQEVTQKLYIGRMAPCVSVTAAAVLQEFTQQLYIGT